MKKILAVIAHPDDESFGIGGTLAKYAKAGVEIHVMCATRGENGRGGSKLGKLREQELLQASNILGVAQVEFMGYVDGLLSNSLYHEMAEKIQKKIDSFAPQVVITFDRLGVSGHIDHIMVAMVTTFVCKKYLDKLKLFYFCETTATTDMEFNYFIYFPPGYERKQVDVIIDITQVWELKKKAIYTHKSQIEDGKWIIGFKEKQPKEEYYLQAFQNPGHSRKLLTDFFQA